MEFTWSLPDDEHETMKQTTDFKPADTWLLQEACMHRGNSFCTTNHKSGDGHKFICKEKCHTDTMIIIHRDLARILGKFHCTSVCCVGTSLC